MTIEFFFFFLTYLHVGVGRRDLIVVHELCISGLYLIRDLGVVYVL